MSISEKASSLEALLFAAGDPVRIARLSLLLETGENEVLRCASELNKEFDRCHHALCVLRMDESLQLCSRGEYAELIRLVLESRKPPSLSEAALETLAVVAYFQPVTAAYISRIRGVDSGYTITTLCDKGLIRPCGRLDVVGRPVIYETTELFLRTMGVSSIGELPPLPEMEQSDAMEKILSQIEELKEEENGGISIPPVPGQLTFEEVTNKPQNEQEKEEN